MFDISKAFAKEEQETEVEARLHQVDDEMAIQKDEQGKEKIVQQAEDTKIYIWLPILAIVRKPTVIKTGPLQKT